MDHGIDRGLCRQCVGRTRGDVAVVVVVVVWVEESRSEVGNVGEAEVG